MKRYFFLLFSVLISFATESVSQVSLPPYEESGPLIEITDEYGNQTAYAFDSSRREESFVKYNPFGVKLSELTIQYDALGNKVLEKHLVMTEGAPASSFNIRWNYDDGNRLISIHEGHDGQTKATRFRYHSNGQVEEILKPDGVRISYTYLDDGQLGQLEASDRSLSYRYSYDHLHRLVSIEDLRHETIQTRKYNSFDELTEEELSPNIKVTYEYDAAGRQIGFGLPDDSKIIYRYEGSQLSSIDRVDRENQIKYTHGYLYDADGRLKSHQLINGAGRVDLHHDHNGALRSIESPWWSQRVDEEDFDPSGRLLSMKIEDCLGSDRLNFSYNSNGELEAEKGHRYAYDSLYNRIGHNGQSWKVNGLNQLVETAEASFVYDNNGNLIEKHSEGKTIFYSYDALDRLTRMESPQDFALTYLYDSFHRRIAEFVWEWEGQRGWHLKSKGHFIYDGFKEIGKVNGEGEISELRLLGHGQGAEMGAAIALELNGKLYAPVHDMSGSVRCLVDPENKEGMEYYRYTAFGEEAFFDGSGNPLEDSLAGNPWRFCSKRVNEKGRSVFFGKRDYDPALGRWTTPDPLSFYDTPNLYAFTKNDPLNCKDLYGLFSIRKIWDTLKDAFFSSFQYAQLAALQTKIRWSAELKLPSMVNCYLEQIGKTLVGESFYLLLGPHFEEAHIDSFGEKEISDKVRVTFVNGILNTQSTLESSLRTISDCHGGVKIHYVFRPTEGWTWDISRAIVIKTAFGLGFRSMHAHMLAEMWQDLIQEMGGVEGGGTILHYAHSLGGTDTDRARELLTPEEQKMIRVITFGSSTLVRNEGFQSVLNIVSANDGVSSSLLEPFGHIRNYFDPDSNVRFYGSFRPFIGNPSWPSDHLLNGVTYSPILRKFGEQFLEEFKN